MRRRNLQFRYECGVESRSSGVLRSGSTKYRVECVGKSQIIALPAPVFRVFKPQKGHKELLKGAPAITTFCDQSTDTIFRPPQSRVTIALMYTLLSSRTIFEKLILCYGN